MNYSGITLVAMFASSQSKASPPPDGEVHTPMHIDTDCRTPQLLYEWKFTHLHWLQGFLQSLDQRRPSGAGHFACQSQRLHHGAKENLRLSCCRDHWTSRSVRPAPACNTHRENAVKPWAKRPRKVGLLSGVSVFPWKHDTTKRNPRFNREQDLSAHFKLQNMLESHYTS